MNAIKQKESTGGINCGNGASGEYGCFQYTYSTWEGYSKEVLGYVPVQTKVNEEYVIAVKVQQWLEEGQSVRSIALNWNQGESHGGKCISGVNEHGVAYDSCEYMAAVVAYHQQNNQY